ncbi:hypothetical protein PsorP6_006138 [Peronosclerospora sorghi]|uniref:Uncharacterized protein n=1 Tax=Peronosclerospora sorghi TaxID=230839 RepID=A0ACC0W4U3_9STRA|nr:hypothetical protein PsorP6_006138 [Peronosclerospora sorghi]
MMIHSASVLGELQDALYKGRELADRGRAGLVGQGGRRRRAGRTWGHKHGKRGTGGRDEAAARCKTVATLWSVASWSGISSVPMRKRS